jgi:hypothetical protein
MSYSDPDLIIDKKRWRIARQIEMLVLDAVLAALESVTTDSQIVHDKQNKSSDMEPF